VREASALRHRLPTDAQRRPRHHWDGPERATGKRL
jgi:hypothetical protein